MIELRALRETDGRALYDLLQRMPPENGFENDAFGLPFERFPAWLAAQAAMARGENLLPGYVPQTTFWALEDGVPVGRVKLRARLTDALLRRGGHIGYGVAPEARGRGVCTRMLRLALAEARRLGIERALVTVRADNAASRRVAVKCGGVLEDVGEEARYWLDTGVEFSQGEPMAAHTTFRIGGPADWYAVARTPAQASHCMRWAARQGLPILALGNGSNLLVRDGGIRGLVLRLADERVETDGEILRAGAGVSLAAAAQAAREAGLSGLEALSGIPGSVGGAAYMNAGAYGASIKDVAASVEALDASGAPLSLAGEALGFGYRESAMQARGLLVTGVVFRLSRDDPAEIGARMADFAARRRQKQPIALPSAGSFFKRPEGAFAGELIERAGLKGFRVGGARVSELHAGFLVGDGAATARDVLSVMQTVQRTVFDRFGIRLEPEVRIVGEDA